MRHKIVHDYLGVDEDVVWQVVTGISAPHGSLVKVVSQEDTK